MNDKLQIETSIEDLRRVFVKDTSDPFMIIINFDNHMIPLHNKLNSPSNKRSNQIVIKTTTNKARSISRKIDEIYQIDPTIDTYEINFPVKLLQFSQTSKDSIKDQKANDTEASFEKDQIEEVLNLLLLSTTKNCMIDKDKKNALLHLKFFLGDELKEDEKEEIDDKTKTQHLIDNIKEAISLLSTQYHYESTKFLSDNFIPFIQSNMLKGIDEDILKEIIDLYIESHLQSQENLKCCRLFVVQNEIREIFKVLKEKDEKELLIYFLISLKIENFNEEMLNYLICNIDDDTEGSDFSRLMFFIKKKLFPLFTNLLSKQMIDLNQVHIDCEYKEEDELNGIISYLIREGGRDVLTNGILTLTNGTDPSLNQYHPITNVTEYGEKINDYFYSFNSTMSPSEKCNFIDFDFGDRQVRVTSYTIRSNKNNENGRYHPKSWKICGSNDKTNWEILDHQLDCPELNGPYKQHHFKCDPVKNKYRYIRYIQEDSFDSARTRTNYKYIIYLTCIEFFGEIF